jgi:hypothetical protein
MPALETVQEYIDEARVLLQDTRVPYRYPTDQIVSALNMALLEARRYRADLFIGSKFNVPKYTAAAPTAAVVMDQQYRPVMIYYIVGRIQLRDDEPTQDSRAGALLTKFLGQLVSIKA